MRSSSTRRRTRSAASSRSLLIRECARGLTPGTVARSLDRIGRTGQGVVVLGVVVGSRGGRHRRRRGRRRGTRFLSPRHGGDDCATGAWSFPTAPTSALDGGVGADGGAFAIDGAGAGGAPPAGAGCVVFVLVLDALSEPRVRTVIPPNPRANARTQAPTSARRLVRDRSPGSSSATRPPRSPSTIGGVRSSGGNASGTVAVAEEADTLRAFRNPRSAKRGRVSGRRRSRAVAWSSWSGP